MAQVSSWLASENFGAEDLTVWSRPLLLALGAEETGPQVLSQERIEPNSLTELGTAVYSHTEIPSTESPNGFAASKLRR
jgi:hypothetical protein